MRPKARHNRPTRLALVGLVSLAIAASSATAQEAGLSLDTLRAFQDHTASQRATARQKTEAKARQAVERPPAPAARPHITPAARLPFDPEPTPQGPETLPVIPLGPLEEAAPIQVLDTDCQPFVRVARASQVTGSFLIDAPCLANTHLLAIFGDNPGHAFTVGEYGGAEFIFGAPDPQLYPLRLFDRDTGDEKLLQDGPDAPIFVFKTILPAPLPPTMELFP